MWHHRPTPLKCDATGPFRPYKLLGRVTLVGKSVGMLINGWQRWYVTWASWVLCCAVQVQRRGRSVWMTVELLHSLFIMAEAALCWQISCKPAQGSAADQRHITIEYYACSFRGKRPLCIRFPFTKTINPFDLWIACISFLVIRSFTDSLID